MSASIRRHRADPRAVAPPPPWKRLAKPAAPRNVAAPRFVGDRAMLELRQRLALDPDAVPQPHAELNRRSAADRLALRVCGVIAIAALVAWGAVSLSRTRTAGKRVAEARVVTAITAVKAKPMHQHVAAAVARPALASAETPAVASAASAAEQTAPAWASAMGLPLLQADVPSAIKTSGPASPVAASAAAESRPGPNPDDIAAFVKRAQAFMTAGDVATARLLLQRAAEAGNAEAALALGASFDPLIVRQARAIGVQTDAAQARQWYEKAAALGSQAASKQLAKLASAGR
jgi:hypothetical protein